MAAPTPQTRHHLIVGAIAVLVGAGALLFTPDVNYLGTLIALGGIGLLIVGGVVLLVGLGLWAAESLRARHSARATDGRGSAPRGSPE